MSPTRRTRRPEPSADDPALDPSADAIVRIEPARATPEVPVEPEFLAEAPPPLDDPEAPGRTPPDPAAAAAATAALAERIVARLNPEQARAVTTTEGPLLILAGAGSGKTRVLAHRVAYLVGVKGVRPWQILAVTFTNRAAGELRERIVALVGEAGRDVQTGTFHAVCARVLRRDGTAIGLDRRFVIYDSDDQATLMKQLLRQEDLPTTGEFRPSAILGAISRAKNEMLDADALEEVALNHHERIVARLARAYQARLKAVGALDFDDLLLEAVRLFQEAPEVLARYQDRWRYLHVDEYQDTNRAQYLWIRALAARYHNLAVVGDDDQSIYSWRGADLRNILDFERDEPNGHRRQARAELPLDAAHPRRRPRGRQPERGAQGQEAVDRERGRPADPALRGLQRGGGGRVDRPPGRGAVGRLALDPHPPGRRRRRAAAAAGHRGDVPDERPEPGDRGGVPALRRSATSSSAGRASTSGAR